MSKAGFAVVMMFVFSGCQTVTPPNVAQMVDPPQAAVNAGATFFALINQERSAKGIAQFVRQRWACSRRTRSCARHGEQQLFLT
jgi:uncharacterized lipoprotein YajG